MDDLRNFIRISEELGECRIVEDADWDLEIGTITELQKSIPNSPLLVFDNISTLDGNVAPDRIISGSSRIG